MRERQIITHFGEREESYSGGKHSSLQNGPTRILFYFFFHIFREREEEIRHLKEHIGESFITADVADNVVTRQVREKNSLAKVASCSVSMIDWVAGALHHLEPVVTRRVL
ncbi:hypothetical protein JTE90_010672 [Oedothorax gibbosus]|uniref:BRCT domain-containing protein n=1 Tax=Oedothorax gibbosus TaxID=931172 RepID=A0AAV6USR2_9ARAC|nr:hypothetical protein JTE90_010672 [Oedothorax gibbosus]